MEYFEPPLQRLFAFSRTELFREHAKSLGGYDVVNTGPVISTLGARAWGGSGLKAKRRCERGTKGDKETAVAIRWQFRCCSPGSFHASTCLTTESRLSS